MPEQHGVVVGVRPSSHTHRKPSAVTPTAAAVAAAASLTTAGSVERARPRTNAAAAAAASLITAGSAEGARGPTPWRHSCTAASAVSRREAAASPARRPAIKVDIGRWVTTRLCSSQSPAPRTEDCPPEKIQLCNYYEDPLPPRQRTPTQAALETQR
ncbi:hypothetical protein NDU88_005414 [Pleurodeles waltl]|uniref:Uncharacterized protein n=1 Tax=Pleurodeles waltl TaxID=8319 RepID=A0AAV7MAF7_PLEWA|nr:hypothetical protein NDU88_005414 [Pleurodeles waltl]